MEVKRARHLQGENVVPRPRLTASQRLWKIRWCMGLGCIMLTISLFTGTWLVAGVVHGVLSVMHLIVMVLTMPMGFLLLDIAERDALR